jgi:hypothetical protein
VLPVADTLNQETVRNHLHTIANRIERGLGEETVRLFEGSELLHSLRLQQFPKTATRFLIVSLNKAEALAEGISSFSSRRNATTLLHLFEILEREVPSERIVLANPFKTRIIAEAQIKTDKVDARILADLLRGRLVSSVHIAGRETRQIREVLRQRCFFVRQRTMLRNRIHRLLGGQHEVKLPQSRSQSLAVRW